MTAQYRRSGGDIRHRVKATHADYEASVPPVKPAVGCDEGHVRTDPVHPDGTCLWPLVLAKVSVPIHICG